MATEEYYRILPEERNGGNSIYFPNEYDADVFTSYLDKIVVFHVSPPLLPGMAGKLVCTLLPKYVLEVYLREAFKPEEELKPD